MDQPPFHFEPMCSAPECGRSGVFKVAAPWSYGSSRELKNYGLCCELHKDELLARSLQKADGLILAEGEDVGPIGVYQILPGVRDTELSRVE